MKFLHVLFCLIFLFRFSLVSAQEFNKKYLLKDLGSYVAQIQKKHANPFNWISRDRFLTAVDSLKNIAEKITTDEFIVGFLKINALLKDEHTNLDLNRKLYYPITFFWFEEGIVATAALTDYSKILGSRLVAINHVPVDTVVVKCKELAAVNTSSGYKTKIPSMLNDPIIFHGLNITSGNDQVIYTFRKQNSDTDIVVKATDRSQGGYEYLLPEKQLLRNSKNSNYWLKYDTEKKYLYINYNKCVEIVDYPFKDFLSSVRQTVEENKPEKIIIDLRYNGGGRSSIFKPLIVALANMPEMKNKKIYTLVGRRTFSAAVINAYQLKTTAHSIIVGEETGGKLNHAGDVRSFKLKHTGITVYYSFRDFYFDATQKGGIIPDIPVKTTLSDYLIGSDPALEIAIED